MLRHRENFSSQHIIAKCVSTYLIAFEHYSTLYSDSYCFLSSQLPGIFKSALLLHQYFHMFGPVKFCSSSNWWMNAAIHSEIYSVSMSCFITHLNSQAWQENWVMRTNNKWVAIVYNFSIWPFCPSSPPPTFTFWIVLHS